MTKPFIAIQISSRDDADLRLTVDALHSVGALRGRDYEFFGTIYFEDEITNLSAFPVDRLVIPIAGLKILRMWKEERLPPNWQMFWDAWDFDQMYGPKAPYLNAAAQFLPFAVVRGLRFDVPKFVKPSNDEKEFAGLVIEPGQTLDEALSKTMHSDIDPARAIMIADIRRTSREYRVFVVRQRVVAFSQYRSAHRIEHRRVAAGDEAANLNAAAEDLIEAGLVPNVRAYAMDLTYVDGEWKVVEFNCFNCSGMYEADRAAIFSALFKAYDDND